MALNVNQIRDILIAELSKNPTYYNLPPAAKVVLNKAIETVTSSSSIQINKQVQSFSNSTINDATKNIIGPNNQYNISTGNLSADQLANNVTPNAANKLLGGLANDLTFNLINELNSKLPPNYRNIIRINKSIYWL